MSRPHVLVVDDSAVVRQAFSMLLAQQFSVDTAADPIIAERKILKKRPDWEIIGEASNGREALVQTESLKPDVIILDITMPQMSGLDVARKITQMTPASRVVMSITLPGRPKR